MGGKLQGLEWLVQHQDIGYTVPEFRPIDSVFHQALKRSPTKSFKPQTLKVLSHMIQSHIDGNPEMVRSDSEYEDGELSFAGIYESFLVENPTVRQIIEHIQLVYKSMKLPKAQTYLTNNNITNDTMNVILQKFIEPDISGVMYTSNPSYPDDLVIEFVEGRNTVVESSKNSMTIEYAKDTKNRVFESDNIRWKHNEYYILDKLAEVGMQIEERSEPSDIEFVIKDDEIYLVQKRQITDLSYPEEVHIPDYREDQFLGSTKIKRGVGEIKHLPALVIGDLVEQLTSSRMMMFPEIQAKMATDYFKNIISRDEQFKDGYVIIMPKFDDTVIGGFARVTNLESTNLNEITRHKKAIITTQFSGIGVHGMSIARENQIHYVGFQSKDEFGGVRTGDIISIYHDGRDAKVYKEDKAPTTLAESYQQRPTEKETGSGYSADYLSHYKEIITDAVLFFEKNFSSWKFEENNGHMGGVFVNEKEQIIDLGIAQWSVAPLTYGWSMNIYPDAYESPSEAEFKKIADQYHNHLMRK